LALESFMGIRGWGWGWGVGLQVKSVSACRRITFRAGVATSGRAKQIQRKQDL
jgi:hypothetical protein